MLSVLLYDYHFCGILLREHLAITHRIFDTAAYSVILITSYSRMATKIADVLQFEPQGQAG